MNDELFDELLESVQEGGAILRGEKAPSRRFEFAAPNVKYNARDMNYLRVNSLRYLV